MICRVRYADGSRRIENGQMEMSYCFLCEQRWWKGPSSNCPRLKEEEFNETETLAVAAGENSKKGRERIQRN